MGKLILVDRSTANSLKEPLGSNCQLRKGRWEKAGSRDESSELVNAGFSQSGGDWLILSSRVEHHLAFKASVQQVFLECFLCLSTVPGAGDLAVNQEDTIPTFMEHVFC